MWRAGDFDGLPEKDRKEMKEKIYLSAERLNNITNNMINAMEFEGKHFDFKFKLLFIGISAVIMGIFWKKVFNKNSFYIPLIIGGAALFVTYPGVVKFLPALMTSIAGNDVVFQIILFVALFAEKQTNPSPGFYVCNFYSSRVYNFCHGNHQGKPGSANE